MFFTKEALDRRTVLRGIGATLALPAGALLPSPPGPSARTWPEVWVREADVRAAVAPYLGTQIPGLSVAVGYRGRVIFARGYGTAGLASRRPVTAQTRFGIGSVLKQMTAGALLTLESDGLLSIDDEVDVLLRRPAGTKWDYGLRGDSYAMGSNVRSDATFGQGCTTTKATRSSSRV